MELQAQIDQAKLSHMKMPTSVQAAYTRRDIERVERELARAQTRASIEQRPRRENWWDIDVANKV
jgi:hypothetical protein